MATWTGAAPNEAGELFQASYRRLWAMRQDEVSSALDRAAYFHITTASSLSTSARLLAVVHMAAHLLESDPADGATARAGGPLSARSNERGSTSFATIPVGTYFGVAAHLLQGTAGGRALLAQITSSSTTAAYVG
jgi:hypothetical protein